MKALNVLYGGRLEPEAFDDKAFSDKRSAFAMCLDAARSFPWIGKTVFLGLTGVNYPGLPAGIETLLRPSWTRKGLLEELSLLSTGFDLVYYSWADCPLLDASLAGALAERHTRYGAEYSYADGWPYGLAPEVLAPAAAGILARLAEGDDGPVERDALFQVIQKDINSFDIETEISPLDLRPYRLSLTADSKRNLLLLSRWMEAGINSASQVDKFIAEKPGLLRTLPAFFNIQITGGCPQTCSLCPWPAYGAAGAESITARKDFMPANVFSELLCKIESFTGDAVISVSLWGEPSLHPQCKELIEMVLARPALALVVETSGVGWKDDELRALAAAASQAAPRKNHMAPLSWIVSLDAHDPERYRELRGPGFSEARSCAKTLLSLFPNDTYVQAVRVKDFEDDIEHFYRSWKEEPEVSAARRKDGSHIIIQKYDDFAGALPKLQASDLSPVKRQLCWHIQRDMNILLDGSVPCCREDLGALKSEGDKASWGNVFTDDLEAIWNRGERLYLEHCMAEYRGICGHCDEYYTYNF